MHRRLREARIGCVAAAVVFLADSAQAQDDFEEEETTRSRSKEISAETGEVESDRSRWIGRVGIGFYGLHAIPLPQASAHLVDPTDPNSPFQLNVDDISRTIAAPAIGIRYWFSSDVGLDVAIGFRTHGGTDRSVDPNGTRQSDLESQTAFLVHGGLPIVLGKHVSVQLTPELNLGFSNGKWRPAPTGGHLPPTVDESGFLLQAGARIGAEVFFGFIGMPEISLDASLGGHLQTRNASVSAGNAEMTRSETGFSTNAFNSPWDFFTSSLAARYYF